MRRVGANEDRQDRRPGGRRHQRRSGASAGAEGNFREDLFYRLNVVADPAPRAPRAGGGHPGAGAALSGEVRRARRGKPAPATRRRGLWPWCGYRWPGNVRELENAMERALLFAQGDEITPEDLPPEVGELRTFAALSGHPAPPEVEPEGGDLLDYGEAKKQVLQAFEQRYLRALLRKTNGNISAAARVAGMERANLRRLLKAHGVDKGAAVSPAESEAKSPGASES